MKKVILVHAVTGMCAASLISNTYCQTNAGFARVEMKAPENTKQQDSIAVPVNSGKEHIKTISIKAVRAFTKRLKMQRM